MHIDVYVTVYGLRVCRRYDTLASGIRDAASERCRLFAQTRVKRYAMFVTLFNTAFVYGRRFVCLFSR